MEVRGFPQGQQRYVHGRLLVRLVPDRLHHGIRVLLLLRALPDLRRKPVSLLSEVPARIIGDIMPLVGAENDGAPAANTAARERTAGPGQDECDDDDDKHDNGEPVDERMGLMSLLYGFRDGSRLLCLLRSSDVS